MKHIITFILALSLSSCDKFSDIQGVTMSSVCQNLHKVEDVDDLLKQFYDNIDSHCLFEMDTKELERIWGIRVFDFYDLQSQFWKNVEEHSKTGEGIFVLKRNLAKGVVLEIMYTEQYYKQNNSNWGGSLGLGQFPKYLPQPDKISALPFEVSVHPALPEHDKLYIKDSAYNSYSFYWWFNKTKDINKPFLEIETGIGTIPSSPKLYQTSSTVYDFMQNV